MREIHPFQPDDKKPLPPEGKYLPLGEKYPKSGAEGVCPKVSIVHQYNTSADDITVERLVSFGRTPHMKMMQARSQEDEEKIRWAMEVTNVETYRDREVGRLSGGQRQRVWIAMALAPEHEDTLPGRAHHLPGYPATRSRSWSWSRG